MYPDFIGIGAQKAGTTWLACNLASHPEIHIPRKEVHYFDKKVRDRSSVVSRFFGKTKLHEDWRRRVMNIPVRFMKNRSFEELRWNYRFYLTPYDDRWYAKVFEPKKGNVSGEITPAYSVLNRKRVAHVHTLMPDAKIIFFMRNPIERLWSQLVMSFDHMERSADAVTDQRLLRRVERESYALLTDYLRTLEVWGEFYPEESIFVGFLEDVSLFPIELLSRLYQFLGVDPSFRPAGLEEKVHSRSSGRMSIRVAARLAETHRERMYRLSERFDGYASFWLYCAERLIETPPARGYIAYPLTGSFLWEKWINSVERPWRVQSGPLASIRSQG